MADFGDKFKSFVGKAREKITEYSELAQTKLEEYKYNLDNQWFETASVHASKQEYQKAITKYQQ